MRAGLIGEMRLPGVRSIVPILGGGWLVTQRATTVVRILDDELRDVALVRVPVEDPDIRVSTDGCLVAVVTGHEIVMVERSGRLLWRVDQDGAQDCHLDTGGVLWVHLSPEDGLVALDALTGREIDRTGLGTTEGRGWFVADPCGRWTGVHLGLGQDGSSCWLTRIDGGRMVLRPLGDFEVAGFSPAGDRYVAMERFAGLLEVRDVATDAVVAARHVEEIVGRREHTLRDAVPVCDDLVLVVATGDDSVPSHCEEHVLVSAGTLRRRGTVEYPQHMVDSLVCPANRLRRWLTFSYGDPMIRLWQIDGPLDDEPIPGQEHLF